MNCRTVGNLNAASDNCPSHLWRPKKRIAELIEGVLSCFAVLRFAERVSFAESETLCAQAKSAPAHPARLAGQC